MTPLSNDTPIGALAGGTMPEVLALFVWYTISGGDEPLDVTREELKGWLADAGIDPEYLPARTRSIDAFRAATTDAMDVYDHNGTTVTLSVEETKLDKDYVVRSVYQRWREAGRPRQRRVGTLQFFRPRRTAAGRVPGTERLTWVVDQRLQGYHKERVELFMNRLVASIDAKQDYLAPHMLRTVIRTFLTNIGAVSVADSGGGAYLVALEHGAQLDAVQMIVRQCGQGCRLLVIPMLDLPSLRLTMLDSIDTDIETRAEAVIKEIGDWQAANPSKTPTTPKWAAWLAEGRALQDRLVEHVEQHPQASFPRAAAAVERLIEVTEGIGTLVAARLR